MDIANVGSALLAVGSSDPGSISGAASLKMLENAMDSNESMSASLTKMMEASVYPHLGGNIDVSV